MYASISGMSISPYSMVSRCVSRDVYKRQDKDSGLVHTVEATPANVHDVTQTSSLLTGEEGQDKANGADNQAQTEVAFFIAAQIHKHRHAVGTNDQVGDLSQKAAQVSDL